jgi:hypothetical protein
MCQSVPVDIPVLGTYTMTLKAGGSGTAVKAKDLFIDMTDLQAKSGTFNNVDIGVATGSITKGKVNPKDHVDPDGYAQQADSIEIIDAHQRVWATSAGTFELPGLHMNIAAGRHDCF